MVEILAEYWPLLITAVAALVIASISVRCFIKEPTDGKIAIIKAWLLYMVVAAEKQFGGGTGAVKLSYVYSKFVEAFPAMAGLITFERFSALVDQVLETFRNMLQSNKNLKEYVEA